MSVPLSKTAKKAAKRHEKELRNGGLSVSSTAQTSVVNASISSSDPAPFLSPSQTPVAYPASTVHTSASLTAPAPATVTNPDTSVRFHTATPAGSWGQTLTQAGVRALPSAPTKADIPFPTPAQDVELKAEGSNKDSEKRQQRPREAEYRGGAGYHRGGYDRDGRRGGGPRDGMHSQALTRSPILEGSSYHAHHTGATLCCPAYDLLLRLSRRKTVRDPITRRDFLGLLCSASNVTEDVLVFRKWMSDLGISPASISGEFSTVCIPFLVGDCLGDRLGTGCKHGHPSFASDCRPLSHPLVLSNGERVRLEKGRVLVAPIVGFDVTKADRGLGGLILGPERDEGFRPCIWPDCRRRDCKYFHLD